MKPWRVLLSGTLATVLFAAITAPTSAEPAPSARAVRPQDQPPSKTARFSGKFYRGSGDVEYLELLDISRRLPPQST